MSFSPCPDPDLGDRAASEAIELMLVPRTVDLGEMKVHRALPSTRRQMVGPFIFFDQMGPAEFLTDEGIDVRPHPHVNLATVTYLLDGEILHRDSLGTEQTIRPGDVNWMRAGSGIVHSERTAEERRRRGQRLLGLQTWVALPLDQEESDAAFIHHGKEALPLLESEGASVRVIAGEAFGARSPLETASETLYADLALAPGARLDIPPSHDERALYTLNGEIEIAGVSHPPGQLLVLRSGETITIRSGGGANGGEAARLMLFGGQPMEGPRWIWWNFVSSRRERIEQAREEWAAGRFDTVPGDEEAFIPLPENGGEPRRAVGGVAYP